VIAMPKRTKQQQKRRSATKSLKQVERNLLTIPGTSALIEEERANLRRKKQK
jgi:hypothetical protein